MIDEQPVFMGGRCVGKLVGDVYVTRRGPQHLFRKFDGFGVSEKLLAYLDEVLAVREVRFVYCDAAGLEMVYAVPLVVLAIHGRRWVDFSSKRFADAQLVISRGECEIVEDEVVQNDAPA